MAVELIYTIRAENGKLGTTQIRVAGSPTIAQATGFAAGYATAMNNIIGGKIESAQALAKADVSALIDNEVDENSDVEHQGKFVFLAENGIRVKCNIPAMKIDQFGDPYGGHTSDALDLDNPDIAAFVDAMIEGIAVTGGVIAGCDVGGSPISSVVFAREAFKNSGKRGA